MRVILTRWVIFRKRGGKLGSEKNGIASWGNNVALGCMRKCNCIGQNKNLNWNTCSVSVLSHWKVY